MVNLIRRLLLHNLSLKFIAFILSLVIFLVVHGDTETEIELSVSVLLKIPDGYRLKNRPAPSVKVRLRGKLVRIKGIQAEHIGPLSVEIPKHTGIQTLTLESGMLRIPHKVELLEITPPEFFLELEISPKKSQLGASTSPSPKSPSEHLSKKKVSNIEVDMGRLTRRYKLTPSVVDLHFLGNREALAKFNPAMLAVSIPGKIFENTKAQTIRIPLRREHLLNVPKGEGVKVDEKRLPVLLLRLLPPLPEITTPDPSLPPSLAPRSWFPLFLQKPSLKKTSLGITPSIP